MAPNIQVLNQLKAVWGRLTNRQRLTIAIFAVLVVAFVSFFVYLVNRTEYGVLFSGLNMEDSGVIAAKLKEKKVEFRVSSDGSTIEVPADLVNELRLEMATQGALQSGSVGFELFDKTSFGITDFTQKVNLRRALEGELARTIGHMKEVKSVRVHLVIPEEKLFKEDQEKAKASVVMALKTGQSLSKDQILGVTNLVSSAVPGLAPDSVAVVDNEGRLISGPLKEDEVQALNKNQLEYRRNLEKEYSKAVLGILEPLAGEGRVKAQVSLAIDMNRVEQTSETYDPVKSAVSQSQKSEEYTPDGNMAGGIPGTRSNSLVPPASQPVSGAASPAMATGVRTRNQESMSYQVSRVIRKELMQMGEVKKATVAVILDNHLKPGAVKGGKGAPEAVPWTAKELDEMKSLVVASIGLDSSRGDLVSIVNVPFRGPLLEEEKPQTLWERYQHLLPTVIKWVGIVLLFLLAYFFFLRPLKKRVSRVLEGAAPQAGLLPAAVGPGGIAMALPPGMSAAGGLEGGPQAALLPPAPEEEIAREQEAMAKELALRLQKSQNVKSAQLQKMIQEEAKKNPEKIAGLIRTWLVE